ncbi:ComEA family DNA-binding protein [Granulimonas faecalis]
MAQRGTRGSGRRVPRWVVVAAGVAALAAVGWIAVGASVPGDVVIERGGDAGPEAPTAEDPGSGDGGAGDAVAQAPEEAAAPPTVHVDGAVASPGVYSLEGDDPRVADAVEAAGGLVEGADTSSLNLAARVEDAMKVHVPGEGEEAAVPSPDGTTQASAGVPSDPSAPVNLNTATAEELRTLPGVGEATAAAILEDREANGPFTSVEDVMRVSGIGEKKFAKMRERIRV